ncbi:hypothetical protein FSP39_008044 [Pinctada imbricata]|uniref:Hexosyltransferase n=1 Tax=Pinctada imbricata TaxID=66713 RepID=A0AA88YFV1_PINIB|nr:hypothetical protein FSP39_008044 [Pinctada imbricata]
MRLAKLKSLVLRRVLLLPAIVYLFIMISSLQKTQKLQINTLQSWCDNLRYEYPLNIDLEILRFGLPLVSMYNYVDHINTWEFEYIHNPKEACQSNWIEILFVIKSSSGNTNRREAIRKTWGREALNYGGSKIIFSLGQTENFEQQSEIEEEAGIYKDILQSSFLDTYRNLTLKTMHNIRWISEFCSTAKHVVMLDDDVILNMKNVVKFFSDVKPFERKQLFAGYVATKSKPSRENKNNKFDVSYEEYPFTCYPDYVSGPLILTTSKVIQMFDAAIPYVKRFVFEDVYLGMVAQKLGIQLTEKYNHRFDFDGTRIENFTCMISSHQGVNITGDIYQEIYEKYAHRTCVITTA